MVTTTGLGEHAWTAGLRGAVTVPEGNARDARTPVGDRARRADLAGPGRAAGMLSVFRD
jgi:hypothetical protein